MASASTASSSLTIDTSKKRPPATTPSLRQGASGPLTPLTTTPGGLSLASASPANTTTPNAADSTSSKRSKKRYPAGFNPDYRGPRTGAAALVMKGPPPDEAPQALHEAARRKLARRACRLLLPDTPRPDISDTSSVQQQSDTKDGEQQQPAPDSDQDSLASEPDDHHVRRPRRRKRIMPPRMLSRRKLKDQKPPSKDEVLSMALEGETLPMRRLLQAGANVNARDVVSTSTHMHISVASCPLTLLFVVWCAERVECSVTCCGEWQVGDGKDTVCCRSSH